MDLLLLMWLPEVTWPEEAMSGSGPIRKYVLRMPGFSPRFFLSSSTTCWIGLFSATFALYDHRKLPFNFHIVAIYIYRLCSTGHAQNILPDRAASGHGLFRSRDFRKSRDWRQFRSKGTTRADIAQLPVAHAEHITIHVTWLTSLPANTTKKPWTQVLANGKLVLLVIRHPPCYSYIQ
jgi:hypothetical protein